MTIEFTGRSYTVTAKQKKAAQDYLERIDHIVGRGVNAHVILSEDKYRMTAEITLKTAHETLVASCEDTDMEKALHDALRKIEQQAVKHKERKLSVERHGKPDSAEPLVELVNTDAV